MYSAFMHLLPLIRCGGKQTLCKSSKWVMKLRAAANGSFRREVSVDGFCLKKEQSLCSLSHPSLTPSCLSFHLSPPEAAVAHSDDVILLTPSRMSQRQVKERDKEKEAGLQTPSREHMGTPSTLSPGVSYSHGKTVSPFWGLS